MASLHQLRLLLWKNSLGVIRQPVLSLTLIIWPLVIFVIIAVTRYQFPPVSKDPCYVSPRNLPSTGFFPFLQTLMCNTDSSCRNKSRLQESTSSKATPRAATRSQLFPELLGGGADGFLNGFPKISVKDSEAVIGILQNLIGPPKEGMPKNDSHGKPTFLNGQGNMSSVLQSMNALKRTICSTTLPLLNRTSPHPIPYPVVAFCKSNSTVLEALLATGNQLLTELMTTYPEEMGTLASAAVLLMDQIQTEAPLWDTLLAVPQLLSNGSVDEALTHIKVLLTNMLSSLHFLGTKLPNRMKSSISTLSDPIAVALKIVNYFLAWPGKGETIPLEDIVKNDTLPDMVMYFVREIEIPLPQAIGLMLDKHMAYSHLCSRGSNPLWLLGACSILPADTFLGLFDSDLLAKQVFLVWSKHVARHDLSFANKLLSPYPEDHGNVRPKRSSHGGNIQPQNIDEALFVEVGQVMVEALNFIPGAEPVVQDILGVAFQTLVMGTVGLQTANEILDDVLKDVQDLNLVLASLMQNQTLASEWISDGLGSLLEVVLKSLGPANVTCEELLHPIEWLLDMETIDARTWTSLFCQGTPALAQAVIERIYPLIPEFTTLYEVVTGDVELNATLPKILSQWYKLHNSSQELMSTAGHLFVPYFLPNAAVYNPAEMFQQSVVLFVVESGEGLEKSDSWPDVKDYIYSVNWILNYGAPVRTPSADCSLNQLTQKVHCDTHLNWTVFAEKIVAAVMKPTPELVLNVLKGTLKFLQDVYGDCYKNLIVTFLNEHVGGDVSQYLINMMNNSDHFLGQISTLPDSALSTSKLRSPMGALLNSTGLAALIPLLSGDTPANVSTVLDVVSKLGRQHLRLLNMFNVTDPTLPELEQLLMRFLSMEENVTFWAPYVFGHCLVTYSAYLDRDDVAELLEIFQSVTNNTLSGIILHVLDLLKEMIDSPNGDPTDTVLSYVQMLQDLVMSMFRLQKIKQAVSPMGPEQVTELHTIANEFFILFTPEGLQNLSQMGADSAQNIVFEKFTKLLPSLVQANASRLISDLKSLQHELAKCAAQQDCLNAISDIITFLNRVLGMVASANGSVSITLSAPVSRIRAQQYEKVLHAVFSLLLAPKDAHAVETSRQILHFVKLLINMQNISLSAVESALKQSNLTLQELDAFAAAVGAANIKELMIKIMEVVKTQDCYKSPSDPKDTARCTVEIIKGVSSLLSQVPDLQNYTTILSLIPSIVNASVEDIMRADFSSNPNVEVAHILNNTLNDIKANLYQNHLATPEIMKEIKVLEQMIKLITNMEPFLHINSSLMQDWLYSEKVFLQIVQWYLTKLENITSGSANYQLLQPLFYVAQMQVTVQLAQTNFSMFVSDQIQGLINSLPDPIDGAGITQIGQTAVKIMLHLLDFMKLNVDLNSHSKPRDTNVLFHDMKQILHLIEQWLKQPNVTSVLSNMLQWGNPSMNVTDPLTDVQQLLLTMAPFLSGDEFLPAISKIMQSLQKAIMVAEQPGGLESNHFLAAIMEVLEDVAMIIPLPPDLQDDIVDIVYGLLKVSLQPSMNFDMEREIILMILNRTESLVRNYMPEEIAQYLIVGIKVANTYFETISMVSGQGTWNNLILNEMATVQNLLPPNGTAQASISVAINITGYILAVGEGNTSLWANIENATPEKVPMIIAQAIEIVSTLMKEIPDVPESVASSLHLLAQLSSFLNEVMNGQDDQDMWDKLEKMLVAVLGGTDLFKNITSMVPVFETAIEGVVNTMHAANVMTQSLRDPMMTLIKDVVSSMNSSHVDVIEVMEEMELAFKHTMLAAEQSNGTLTCTAALSAWEKVRATLSNQAMSSLCKSLQPVRQAYADAVQGVQHSLNNAPAGTMTVHAAAARIVRALRSLHDVSRNQSLATNQLVQDMSNQFHTLTGKPLSHQAQEHWYEQLQELQLQDSLASISQLTELLLNVTPHLHLYIKALEKALVHVANNSHRLYNCTTAEELFKQAAMIFANSANITSSHMFPMMWGNFSSLTDADVTELMETIANAMTDMLMLEHSDIYEAIRNTLMFNETKMLVKKVLDMAAWLTSTEASGLNLLMQMLPKLHDIVRCFLSLLDIFMEMPANTDIYVDLAGNLVAVVQQAVSTRGFPPLPYSMFPPLPYSNHTVNRRRKREAPMMGPWSPMMDFEGLLYVDYSTLYEALQVPPTYEEVMETVHVFVANPDLNVVLNGVTRDLPWDSREQTINSVLQILSLVTRPDALESPPLDLLEDAVDLLPDDFPFSSLLKNITKALANDGPGTLNLLTEMFYTVNELFQTSVADEEFNQTFSTLTTQVCVLEKSQIMQVVLELLRIEPDVLCSSILPGLQSLIEQGMTSEALFETFIGDPETYNLDTSWSSVIGERMGFNTSGLRALNIQISSPGDVKVGDMLRNKTAFVLDVQRHMNFPPGVLLLVLNTTLPNNNLKILSWFAALCKCRSVAPSMNMDPTEAMIFGYFCSMSPEQWYHFVVLTARHADMEKVLYRLVLCEETQELLMVLLQMTNMVTDLMMKILPAISQMETYMTSMNDVKMDTNSDFSAMPRGATSRMSSEATFVTLSRALCSKGIMALFGISRLTTTSQEDPSVHNNPMREEMIERFKLPRNSTPFCMNMYLDMVSTTGGAIAWAFLKPMLMGQILYTPDTPVTRDIMEKANATLHEFANLRRYSKEWVDSSEYIVNSANILGQTLPMLQSSLSNSFVKNFIEMQTDIDVDKMKDTLSNFSNMTILLDKNKHVLKQITALSNLMVDLSSCIKFDRYVSYDSEEELNAAAQDLAKHRSLYASVIFKLPKDSSDSSKHRPARSTSASSLPPKVSYTIRMHMDNVMRTDRVRQPFFLKDPHISAHLTMRYNRGFVYLQENIDRAIIETHAGQKVTQTAVQLQPFPYPCHFRDEYLEAIGFVFPFMLMIAWALFVADFVKKLVYEKELRLQEYMKMMGVNPISHFFAWFLECAFHLLMTIIILTLILKYGKILHRADGFVLFLYLCDYGLSLIAFSFLISSFFDRTYIAGLSGSLLYVLSFFPYIIVMAMETNLNITVKSLLSLFSPTCFSYASQYVTRYEAQGEGIQWSNMYRSPIATDECSFGWLCWMMVIDSILYTIIGAYIRMVFPGKYGIAAPWYFPFKSSFWADLCCFVKPPREKGKGLFFSNVMQKNQPVFSDDKGKGQGTLSFQSGEDFTDLPVGVTLHSLTKTYGEHVGIQNLNLSFHEGHVTSLLGHNGAGKTTTMSLLTGLFAPSSGTIEVYGKDMESNIEDIRKELGVCMQYDVLFDHMTAKEHLLLYAQIKAPHWTPAMLHEQVRAILEETGMYAHRHKRVGTLSGGMKRKLSISIAFIGGSRLVVLDEPTTGVDPCSRRSIWDIVIQHKKHRTIIMSTHHLDEAEVLSDCIAFLERGGLKCSGSPFHLKDKLGQGYKLTLTKKMDTAKSEKIDNAEIKEFIQAHVPEARLKEAQGSDLVYSLPLFKSSNASSYRSLLTALDANLDGLQLGGYGISDTTLEEVFLQLTRDSLEDEKVPLSISETISDTGSLNSFSSDSSDGYGDQIKLCSPSTLSGMALLWQQVTAILIKRFHHSRRDRKGMLSQILLPVVFVLFAMGLGAIKNDMQHFPEMVLSPALYNIGPSFSFFSNHNSTSRRLVDTMLSFPGIDNECLDKPDNPVCMETRIGWGSKGNKSTAFHDCNCKNQKQVCETNNYLPPSKEIPSSQRVFNLTDTNVENYLLATANDFIRNRYGGFEFGLQLPHDLQMDLKPVPQNRTLSKVWFNPEGYHTMPAYMNSLNNLILRSNLPADKDPSQYAISVSSHPYFGRVDDEDIIVTGMLQILVAMCVIIGYTITTASFVVYEVDEHHNGAKMLQHVAGVSEPLYWAVNFFYDMALFMIPVGLTIAVVACFQIPAFTDRHNLAAVTLLIILFGFATFPWMYLLSGLFRNSEVAFVTYMCINLFISVNTIMSTSTFYFLGQIVVHHPENIKAMFDRLCHAFYIFPQFNFGNGLMYLARSSIEVQLLSGYGIDAYKDPFSIDALGGMLIASFIQGVVFFTLRLLVNKSLIRKVRHFICGRKNVPQVVLEDMDEDVAAEHMRVSSGSAITDILQVNQLTKVYQHLKTKVQAVHRLSVGIAAGECFGLLGVNGAGKTTTFKMLAGDVSPTDGTAQIRDRDGHLVDIMECHSKGVNIGYCPQVDALDSLLSGAEHLYFYARIRGISKREIDQVVNYLLKRLELNYHRDIMVEGYSCGTRRKLSTAMALVGHPQILLLDEPSSGMDPRTKRHLWKILSEEVKGKCAVVLTSHSMEECEALCGRLAIMVKGQFRCLGSLQHIKNRFGRGFTVKMYLAEASSDAEAITSFMQRMFPSTYLKDQHATMLEYHVPVAPGGVADIFDQVESNKSALQIKHFSVSQTTLDEVFINFAMGKIGTETTPIDFDDDLDSIETADT